jgi:hypothetical protein
VPVTDIGVAVVTSDGLIKGVNTISFAVADEAKRLWADEIVRSDSVEAVVFIFGKLAIFILSARGYFGHSEDRRHEPIGTKDQGRGGLFHKD